MKQGNTPTIDTKTPSSATLSLSTGEMISSVCCSHLAHPLPHQNPARKLLNVRRRGDLLIQLLVHSLRRSAAAECSPWRTLHGNTAVRQRELLPSGASRPVVRRSPVVTSNLSEKTSKPQATGGLLVYLHAVDLGLQLDHAGFQNRHLVRLEHGGEELQQDGFVRLLTT